MKINIPAYEPSLECTQRLRHGEINIDLGENVVEVVRCVNCANGVHKIEQSVCCKVLGKIMNINDYCSYGEVRVIPNDR